MTARFLLGALLGALAAGSAEAGDPEVPIGQDPGGAAVALISSGIDYTIPSYAKTLARDGEGEIVAWDFVDNDNRPFAAQTDMSATAMMALLAAPDTRIVPVRISYADPLWLAKAAAFAERTPAVVVVTPLSAIDADIDLMAQVAKRFTKLHFVVVPAGAAGSDRIEASAAGLANVSVIGERSCNDKALPPTVSAAAAKLCAAR